MPDTIQTLTLAEIISRAFRRVDMRWADLLDLEGGPTGNEMEGNEDGYQTED